MNWVLGAVFGLAFAAAFAVVYHFIRTRGKDRE